MQEGIIEAEKIGREKAIKEVVNGMIKKGLSITEIADLIGVSEDGIYKINENS